jgi:Domain of unknown function (DUF4917)
LRNEHGYPTLHGVADAKGLLASTAPLFAKLGTTDFEHVLLACWYADHVNRALGVPSANISAAYAEVRTALIEAVHSVHPVHADVDTDLQRVGAFANVFPTVVNLNYDLTLYWAMLLFNAANGSWFKDAFHHGEFQTDWGYPRLARVWSSMAGALTNETITCSTPSRRIRQGEWPRQERGRCNSLVSDACLQTGDQDGNLSFTSSDQTR